MLAAVTVTNNLDVVNGDTSSIAALIANSGGDGIALREALEAANNTIGADAIAFDPSLAGGMINLLDELRISDDVMVDASTLTGGLTIDAGNGPDHAPYTFDGFRVFNVDDGDNDNQVEVSIRGLTLTGGDSSGFGGAVFNREDLTIDNSNLVYNSAGRGGGIFNHVGKVTVTSSTISGNAAFRGGGIYNHLFGAMTVAQSTVRGNSGYYGGGIENEGAATITSSTVSGNSATMSGGGIASYGPANVIGTTLSGNSAGWSGGAIENHDTATISGTTITDNSANYGGGICNRNIATLSGSLVAGNSATGSPDVRYSIGGTNNLIGDGTGMTGLLDGVNGNQVGTSANPIDPLLGPLQDNGGPTFTHALLPGSSAIDAGDPTAVAGVGNVPLYDQRGAGYERVVGAVVDVGAYELLLADGNLDGMVDGLDYLLWAAHFENDPADDPPGSPKNGDYNNDGKVDGLDYVDWASHFGEGAPSVPFAQSSVTLEHSGALSAVTVTNNLDVVNGNTSSIAALISNDGGDGISLREAVLAANDTNGADEIYFAASLAGATIELLGEMPISDAVTIDATALAAGLTIDAGDGFDHHPWTGDGYRIFNIDDGDNGNQVVVQLSGLTLTGGDRVGDGGAIFNRENLTITNSSIEGNAAGSRGGGIFNLATMSVIDSTISGNSAGYGGGGIFNDGTVTVTNSTLSGNLGVTFGGAVLNFSGAMTLIGSTLSGNSAYYGGGIFNEYGSPMTITNSTLSGNSAGWSGGGIENHGTATIRGTTITNNTANYGGGISDGNILTLAGSIVAGNMAVGAPDIDGSISGSYNLIGTGGSGGLVDGIDGNQVGVADPLLGPLADNGGPTFTHALLPGSPAINTGDPAAMAGVGGVPINDQRGAPFDRVAGGRIDIGAVESQTESLPGDGNGDGWVDGLDYLLWAGNFGTHPGPDGDISDGDYNDDGWINGLDYLLWAANYGNHTASAASQTDSAEQRSAFDAAVESYYDNSATMAADELVAAKWQISRAFDAVVEKIGSDGHNRPHFA